ncbi:MAG TPA: extracellular solute-binding protein [Firmicutes bacterium]|jgi:multiple sugar transport system substrate-binding protein|nr:extracellular solute-binding protein [Bacillota bacterium]
MVNWMYAVRRTACIVMMVLACIFAAGLTVGAKTTLEFWHSWGTNEDFQATLDRFEALYPDIEINAVPLAASGRESKVLAAMISNTAPDVLMATRSEVIQFADVQMIIPIDNFVRDYGINLSRFYRAEIDGFKWDNQLWALPMPTSGGNESLIFYNKDVFAELGLNPEIAPKTWQDIEALAKRANRWEGGLLTRLGFDVATFNRYNALLYSNNGNFLSPDGRSAAFGSPEGRYALEWMYRFTNEVNGGLTAIRTLTAGAINDRFMEGKVAAVYAGVSVFPVFLSNEVNFGVGLIPYNADNPNAFHRGVAGRLYGWGYVMPTSIPASKIDAAFKFIKFLTTEPQGGCEFLKVSARPTPLRDCNADRSYFQRNPHWDVVGQALELDVPYPMTPVDASIQPLINNMVTAVMNGQQSPSAGIDNAVRQVQAILDAFWADKDSR